MMAATIAIALGAGHYVQTEKDRRSGAFVISGDVVISSIVPVAARSGPEPIVMGPDESARIPLSPAHGLTFGPPVRAEMAAPTAPALAAPQTPCDVTLEATALPGAMVGLTLRAPCSGNERAVIRHHGLSVTELTSAAGVLSATIPALASRAEFFVRLASGGIATAAVEVPDAERIHRFGIQWQTNDAFQIHAYLPGAERGGPGHVSAALTGEPGPAGGFLTILGDGQSPLPLLAEIYTYPRDGRAMVELEATVTPETCGRRIVGEIVSAHDGQVEKRELTLDMPDCASVGDVIVIPDPIGAISVASIR